MMGMQPWHGAWAGPGGASVVGVLWPFGLTEVPLLLALPVLLVISGFFSGSETALFGVSGHTRVMLLNGKGVVGRSVRVLLANPRMLLITLMFGNMVTNVLYFVISSVLLLKASGKDVPAAMVVVFTLMPLVLIVVFGEVLPKMVASSATVAWIRTTALLMAGIHELLGPVRLVLDRGVITPLSRLIAPRHRPPALSAVELEALVELSRQRGVIDRSEEELLHEVMELGRMKVRAVMVPRVDLVWFDIHEGVEKLWELIEETRMSKIPVCDGDLDHVLGLIYSRQFLLSQGLSRGSDLRKLIRGVRFVPELQRVDDLLAEFRKSGTHVAIVVDEYGGTAGLVTLKDVVGQIVGDLSGEDEGEAAGEDVQEIGPGEWRVSGRLSVHDWGQTLGEENLPVRVTTVGGLVMSLLGRVAKEGDRVQVGNMEMEVERMEGWRVTGVRLRLAEEDEKEGKVER